jgi:acyl-CoA dehydrogenase
MMKSPFFNDEHEVFRGSVRQFVEKDIVPNADKWEEAGRIPPEIWQKMGELGFLGVNYPEEFGGSAADFFYTVVFLEELARSTMGGFSAAVSVHQYMATAHISKAGSKLLKEKYLIPAIKGEKIGALAISEPNCGSDVSGIQCRAVRDGDYYIINGAKTFITNGFYGNFVTLAVKTKPEAGANGISLIVVDTDSEGFTRNKLKKMGWNCSDTAEMFFTDVRVPAENIIGEENQGFYYIMESFQLERLVASILGVAGAEYCLEITVKYINERQAFNKNLAKFQAIRHTLAELSSELEAAKQLTYYTSWLYSQGEVAVKHCSMAKLITTELAKKIADACLQFFGGYGYMNEYVISRIYRDARVGTIAGGTSEIMKEIISKLIIDNVNYKPVYEK